MSDYDIINDIVFPQPSSDADVKYDKEANALYINVWRNQEEWNKGLRDRPKLQTIPIKNCEVFIDVNEDDMIQGIEILLPVNDKRRQYTAEDDTK